jgi:hypothetical protein
MPFSPRLRIERVAVDVRVGEQLDLHGGDVVIAASNLPTASSNLAVSANGRE